MNIQKRMKSIFELEMERSSYLSNYDYGRNGDPSQTKADSKMILLLRYPIILTNNV
jgi:hypothetical protein